MLFLISKINVMSNIDYMCLHLVVKFLRLCAVRYLYREITAFKTGDSDCILEQPVTTGNSLLRVKVGTTFHLYISAPPCGDASLFSRYVFCRVW